MNDSIGLRVLLHMARIDDYPPLYSTLPVERYALNTTNRVPLPKAPKTNRTSALGNVEQLFGLGTP